MSAIIKRDRTSNRRSKTKLKTQGKTDRSTVRLAKGPKPIPVVNKLRSRLALTQAQFAPLLPVSVRSLATLESGVTPTDAVARRLTELDRLTVGLSEVIKKESLGKWLQTPNQAFDGLKPLEVITRGESDRLWEMIYFLRSGVPS